MRLVASLAALVGSVLAAVLIVFVSSSPITGLRQYHEDLGHLMPQKSEPYGGCDEAYLYPDTPGYRWCERNGYLG